MQAPVQKLIFGVVLFLLLVFVILFPALLFSTLNPTLSYNDVQAIDVAFSA